MIEHQMLINNIDRQRAALIQSESKNPLYESIKLFKILNDKAKLSISLI